MGFLFLGLNHNIYIFGFQNLRFTSYFKFSFNLFPCNWSLVFYKAQQSVKTGFLIFFPQLNIAFWLSNLELGFSINQFPFDLGFNSHALSFYVTKTVLVSPKWFWSDQIDLDLTIMIWSRPKWNGRDQNELVATKMNWSGLKNFLEPAMFCHLAVLKEEGLKMTVHWILARFLNWCSESKMSCFFSLLLKRHKLLKP